MDFAVPADDRVKLKENEKKDKYLDLAREFKKKLWNMKVTIVIILYCNWCSWYSHQRIGSKTGKVGNRRTSGDDPNYRITKISQNTEKSPRSLRRLYHLIIISTKK